MKHVKTLSLIACLFAFSGSQASAHPNDYGYEEELCGGYTPSYSNSGLILYFDDPEVSGYISFGTSNCQNTYTCHTHNNDCGYSFSEYDFWWDDVYDNYEYGLYSVYPWYVYNHNTIQY